MKKSTLKILSLAFVAVCCFFVGSNVVSAAERNQTSQTFTFDWTFKLQLGTTLVQNSDGNYEVDIVGYQTVEYTNEVDLSDADAIHYLVTEIDEDTYNTIKAYQDAVDALDRSYITTSTPNYYKDNATITAFEDALVPYWCYNKYTAGTVVLPADCDTHYYVVTVDAADVDYLENSGYQWNYHSGRVYKVEANATSCPSTTTTTTTEEENPSTGISTPYVVGAVAIVGGIIVIAVSKKKKYI